MLKYNIILPLEMTDTLVEKINENTLRYENISFLAEHQYKEVGDCPDLEVRHDDVFLNNGCCAYGEGTLLYLGGYLIGCLKWEGESDTFIALRDIVASDGKKLIETGGMYSVSEKVRRAADNSFFSTIEEGNFGSMELTDVLGDSSFKIKLLRVFEFKRFGGKQAYLKKLKSARDELEPLYKPNK